MEQLSPDKKSTLVNNPVRVKLDEQTEIEIIPITSEAGYGQVSSGILGTDQAFNGINALSKKMGDLLKDISPDEASIEFSMGFSVKSSQLLAVLVNADAEGAFKVCLKWKK